MWKNMLNKCSSVDELKRVFRALALQNHPDRGGDLETMQEINVLYQKLLKNFDNSTNASGFTYHYDEQKENKLMDLFLKIINLDLEGLIVEIIGSWLWVSGEKTFTFKKKLKELGLKWSKNKKSWYFHFDDYKKHHGKSFSLSEIRELWGVKEKEEVKKKFYPSPN